MKKTLGNIKDWVVYIVTLPLVLLVGLLVSFAFKEVREEYEDEQKHYD